MIKSHLNAHIVFADQIQIYHVLHEPKEASRGCVWDLFELCQPRHFSDSLHFNTYLLELCEKVSYPASGQDQKDYTEAHAIDEVCLEIIQNSCFLHFGIRLRH